MECAKRIGIISNSYANVASPYYYLEDLTSEVTKEYGVNANRTLEIKKQLTFKRDTKTKVLVVCVI